MTELNSQAERIILLHCQQMTFTDEYDSRLRKQQVATNSKILLLNPFLDVDDLLRARGRIVNADIPENMKYPITLPANHRVTQRPLFFQTMGRYFHVPCMSRSAF